MTTPGTRRKAVLSQSVLHSPAACRKTRGTPNARASHGARRESHRANKESKEKRSKEEKELSHAHKMGKLYFDYTIRLSGIQKAHNAKKGLIKQGRTPYYESYTESNNKVYSFSHHIMQQVSTRA